LTTRSTESQVITWLAGQHDTMVELLRRMVTIDSGTYDKVGVDKVGDVVRQFLSAHDIQVDILPQRLYGDCLRASVPAKDADPGNVLLMGHCDTVFPKGEAARRPFLIRDSHAYGPGVMDMKAGLVMNCFVLAAFARFGGAPAPIVALFTGDEEIGSPEGRPVLEAEARRARIVLNSEPARVTGNVVTGRKGGIFMTMRITGKAAHSGVHFRDGISAISELARKIAAIDALTDLDREITLNVGLVKGGQSVNTMAPSAEGQIDLRYVTPADRDEMMAKIAAIIERSFIPGTSATLTVNGEFLPMVPTEASNKLFELYAAAASATGFQTKGEFAGSCADSGFAARFAPTLCAVGPEGLNGHTPEEFLRIDTMVPRAQACARLILGLGGSGL
jgi:glutamate carboxypeptidase